jgi:hypothetical protein
MGIQDDKVWFNSIGGLVVSIISYFIVVLPILM